MIDNQKHELIASDWTKEFNGQLAQKKSNAFLVLRNCMLDADLLSRSVGGAHLSINNLEFNDFVKLK